jgi:hypothetical protein
MEPAEIRKLARFILEEWESQHSADNAPKWDNATVKFVPNDPSLKEHEMPMEKFMHKVIMVRNNLRVLEQQVNSNSKLTEGEKIKLQGYISKCYGSLTSFNFMFWDEEDKFSSK